MTAGIEIDKGVFTIIAAQTGQLIYVAAHRGKFTRFQDRDCVLPVNAAMHQSLVTVMSVKVSNRHVGGFHFQLLLRWRIGNLELLEVSSVW